LEEIETS
jgi:hypothetical protein